MAMRTRWRLSMLILGCLVGAPAILIVRNPAPLVPAIPSSQVVGTTLPYVVKLHARWCPVCMVTKDVWATVQDTYGGRVRLVVFDFTSAATTEASRIEAKRLGLEAVFDEYGGETGTVLVLDGTSKRVRHELHGNRDPADYRAAIDASLAETQGPR
jgi:hypothetical protein